jgi:hypothetical protein
MTEKPSPPRRRPVRLHFRNGVEAALRADPRALAACEPRTGLGVVVRALVQEAGRGKTAALRELLSLLDWQEPERDETQTEDAAEAEQILKAEPRWDWNESADWDFTPREKPAGDAAEAGAANENAPRRFLPTEEEENYYKKELARRFARLHEADVVEAQRRAKLNGTGGDDG